MPKRQSPLPFGKDLGDGWHRVDRAMARKLWSFGLPVRLQPPGGTPLAIKRPAAIPVPKQDRMDAFREACGAVSPEAADGPAWSRCLFLSPHGCICLHLEFTDGSNPFVKYGTGMELWHELYAWSTAYSLSAKGSDSPRVAVFLLDERKPGTGRP